MLQYLAIGASMLLSAAVAAEPATPAMPAWMSGCWVQERDTRWAEECWMAPRAGVMLGAGRTGDGDKLRDWKAMQIMAAEPADGSARLEFWASPRGAARVRFTQSIAEMEGIAFVNAAHDYPQRIHYWREGARLKVRISLLDGSRAAEWDYAPMGGGG